MGSPFVSGGSSDSTLAVDRERKLQPHRRYERPNFECESKIARLCATHSHHHPYGRAHLAL